MGYEKADAIEKESDLFYNHERFHIWQVQAHFRALIAKVSFITAVRTILTGGRGGLDLINHCYPIAVSAIVVTYMAFFSAIHRIVGYNNEVDNEQAYETLETHFSELPIH